MISVDRIQGVDDYRNYTMCVGIWKLYVITLSMPLCSVRGPPASGPRPVTTFKAPLGSPAAVHISARSRQESGASSEGCVYKLKVVNNHKQY